MWFGMTGRIVNTIASLCMLLFTITGFLLYLDRRKKKRYAKLAASNTTALGSTSVPNYLIVYASQTGTAEQLAWHTASIMISGGISPIVKPLSAVTNELLETTEKALFILSTFGEGEPPDSARTFIKKSIKLNPVLNKLQFGLLALGDKRYRDYCGFASQVEAWLLANGARNLFTRIDVDNSNEHAIQQWQQHVAAISGVTSITEWSAPEYELWTLQSRKLLNAGSVGAAIYSVALIPPHIGNTRWEAGDILEIKPQHDSAKVDRFIQDNGLVAEQLVNNIPLKNWLSISVLPNSEQLASDVTALVKSLEPLSHREYSIASLPAHGKLELVVRQGFDESGNLGLGSGWLTAYAQEGEKVWVRIRSNPSFHAPQVAAPMILIGAGTGIAGLRAHLQARHIAGEKENWLIFGERQRKHDRLFGEEIDDLKRGGFLAHCDEVFSRDGDSERYVQDRLLVERDRLIDWLSRGASVLVCGSLTGMGEGVDETLGAILGENELQSLRESGRYRRDLY
jgi:sulfite reductase (NADPH) flavoprotein alpha-component